MIRGKPAWLFLSHSRIADFGRTAKRGLIFFSILFFIISSFVSAAVMVSFTFDVTQTPSLLACEHLSLFYKLLSIALLVKWIDMHVYYVLLVLFALVLWTLVLGVWLLGGLILQFVWRNDQQALESIKRSDATEYGLAKTFHVRGERFLYLVTILAGLIFIWYFGGFRDLGPTLRSGFQYFILMEFWIFGYLWWYKIRYRKNLSGKELKDYDEYIFYRYRRVRLLVPFTTLAVFLVGMIRYGLPFALQSIARIHRRVLLSIVDVRDYSVVREHLRAAIKDISAGKELFTELVPKFDNLGLPMAEMQADYSALIPDLLRRSLLLATVAMVLSIALPVIMESVILASTREAARLVLISALKSALLTAVGTLVLSKLFLIDTGDASLTSAVFLFCLSYLLASSQQKAA